MATATKQVSVLIIEDQRDVADSLALFLEHVCSFRVSVARNGEAGVGAALRELPDVVVCDIGLPKMDGYQVAAELAKKPRKPLLIAVTAYGDDEAKERAMGAGFDHYLVKPADPEELEAIVRKHLKLD
jgi:two-component system, sensor histidine kinase